MKRNGKTLAVLRDGHPRRLADLRNGWRKASDEQRAAFVKWVMTPDPDGLWAAPAESEIARACDAVGVPS